MSKLLFQKNVFEMLLFGVLNRKILWRSKTGDKFKFKILESKESEEKARVFEVESVSRIALCGYFIRFLLGPSVLQIVFL